MRGPLLRELEAAPDTLLRLLRHAPQRYPVLLDSAAAGSLGRWSILAAGARNPLGLRPDGTLSGAPPRPPPRGFLAALEADWRDGRLADLERPRDLPFIGGWFVFLGYEVADEIEPSLVLPRSRDAWSALALRVPAAVLQDGASGRLLLVAEPGEEALLERLAADVVAVQSIAPAAAPGGAARAVHEEPPALFLERVARIQEAIAAGEIYQANLSRLWTARLNDTADPVALYETLRRTNPAPFAAFLRWRGLELLSSSPERLLRIEDGWARTRPIAGTRARSPARDQDALEAERLLANPKERAEHVMLIDLERNDLGRVCQAGSVTVEDYMVVETYAHVHHIVSGVSGRLRGDVTPIEALRAVFPGGTITGCPKIRCMQIVAAAEGAGRGAYTGSLGYIGHDGSADFNILIRTLSLSAGEASLRAGAGIVADSVGQHELEETRAKARGLIAALESAA